MGNIILLICAFILILLSSLYLFLRFRPLRRQLNQLPHEPAVNLLIGNVSLSLENWKNMGQSVINQIFSVISSDDHQRNGILTYWVGPVPMVLLFQAQYIEQLLTSQVNIDKGYQYTFGHRWLGTGLLTSSGHKWRGRRKMLTPSFHFKILEDFIPIMNGKTRILHQVIDSQLNNNNGFITDMSRLYLMCALDIICQSAMGCDVDAQRNSTSSYVKSLHQMSLTLMDRAVNPLFYAEIVYHFTETKRNELKNLQILHKFTNQVIMRRKKEIKLMIDEGINPETVDDMGRKRKLAFMDSLITEHLKNPSFTQEHIREEVDTFMFEGHDTTGWGVTWATFMLGHHQEIQAKVHEEMDTIFGSDRDRDITMDDLREMRYLEMCIKESQRMFPSAPLINRTLKDDMVVNVKGEDITIPAGVEVAIFIYNLHRNKYLWTEPDKFDPERFNVENSKERNPFSYVPFSAGPRNCIGQKFAILEEKAILASIFRRFKVTSMVPVDEINLVVALVLKSDTQFRTKLEFR